MDSLPNHFIVCGLGSLGQQTIVNLKRFSQKVDGSAEDDVLIAAIDLGIPAYWEVENLLDLLVSPPIVGDSRRYDLLRQAGIEHCRSILILTSDESVNVETALAARRLNPQVHIVLRSSRVNLNQLLKRQLGRFVALDALELPANTFALAGISNDILGVFKIGDYPFRVVRKRVFAGDLRYDKAPLYRLHQRKGRLLDVVPQLPRAIGDRAITASHLFHRWPPEMTLCPGDEITTVEIDYAYQRPEQPLPETLWGKVKLRLKDLNRNGWHRQFLKFWQDREQRSLRRVTAIALSTVLISWPVGTLLLKQAVPSLDWGRAIALGAILLLGGYGDVFGGLEGIDIPVWLPLICLLIALVSLFLVLGVFSLLAEQLLSSRFEFLRRRPRLPSADHIIVVGIGRLGYRAINILREFNQPLIAITQDLSYPELINEVPLLVGNLLQSLQAANIATAKSVIAVTDDPMLNLEVALIVSEAATAEPRESPFVPIIRTINQTLSDNVAVLLPQAKAFSVYALSAEAFSGAAFGENILSLFRLQNQTILVTEYRIAAGDHLGGKLLAEVAYGYGVVPILLKARSAQGEWRTIPMPGDELRLQNGDQLHVLSSINGLRRIERGEMTLPRLWRLQLAAPLNQQMLLSAGNILVRLSGLDLAWCRNLMNRLPATVELSLYDYQAYRLQKELERCIPTQLSPL